ncbi:hypothetical protein Tco_0878844 [Tanacetum coccineum]|uniref:Uncharacterized protein n=1 Tax=Tanacetum coccineum TaxID=301880 RepID=A0ABQ5C0L6_9ASTR
MFFVLLNGGGSGLEDLQQSTTQMSTTESEYIAASMKLAMEAVWIEEILSQVFENNLAVPLQRLYQIGSLTHHARGSGASSASSFM